MQPEHTWSSQTRHVSRQPKQVVSSQWSQQELHSPQNSLSHEVQQYVSSAPITLPQSWQVAPSQSSRVT